jgi:hypothetical protein
VAVVNQEFARKVFGAATNAMGGSFRMKDGARIQVVGIAEDGKYEDLAENPSPVVFVPVLQWPSIQILLVVRSKLGPLQLGPAIRSTVWGPDAALPLTVTTWNKYLDVPFFAPRMAARSLGVLGAIAAILVVTGIFGLAAFCASVRPSISFAPAECPRQRVYEANDFEVHQRATDLENRDGWSAHKKLRMALAQFANCPSAQEIDQRSEGCPHSGLPSRR